MPKVFTWEEIVDRIASRKGFAEKVQEEWDAGEFVHPDGEQMFADVNEAIEHMASVKLEEWIASGKLGAVRVGYVA